MYTAVIDKKEPPLHPNKNQGKKKKRKRTKQNNKKAFIFNKISLCIIIELENIASFRIESLCVADNKSQSLDRIQIMSIKKITN